MSILQSQYLVINGFCAFKELLSHVPWDQLDFHSDIEDAWTYMYWKDLFFLSLTLFSLPSSGNKLTLSTGLLMKPSTLFV